MTQPSISPATKSFAVASVLSLVLSGCAVESDSGHEDDITEGQDGVSSDSSSSAATEDDMPVLQGSGFNLIEEVVLPGRRVGFYELDDGTLMTVQAGELGNVSTSVEERALHGARLYQFLTHRAAPQRLVDAEARAGEAAQNVSSEATSLSSDKGLPGCGQPQGGCSLGAFTRDNWLMDRCTGSRGFALRIEDLWHTGDSIISHIDTNRFSSALLVNHGRVRFEASFNRRGKGNYAYMLVSANHYVEFDASSTIRRSAFSAVYEADGDRFDHCVRWN